MQVQLTAEATADEAPAPKKRKLAAKDSDIDPTGTPKADEESEMEDHVDAATEEGLENAVESTGAVPPAEPKIRTQLIVPVTSASCEVTPLLLQRVFAVRGVSVQQILLGLVDSNGVVTRCCLYNYIQPPLEGPGTANLELLDD